MSTIYRRMRLSQFSQSLQRESVSFLHFLLVLDNDSLSKFIGRSTLVQEHTNIFSLVTHIFQTFFNNYQEKFKLGLRQLSKRKVKHEDWNLFQMCLTLMQTTGKITAENSNRIKPIKHEFVFTGEFLSSVENFEKQLLSDIIDAYNKLRNPVENVFHQYRILLLSSAAQTDLQEFVESTKTGNFYGALCQSIEYIEKW